jgi:outer membrane lipoprotein carrier protein
MLKSSIVIGSLIVFSSTVFGGGAAQVTEAPQIKTGKAVLRAVEKKYQSSKGTVISVQKILKLKLLNREKISKGKIELLPPGRLRLELVDEQKTIFLIDGKRVWLIEFADQTDKNPVGISSSKNPKQIQSQALAGFLLGKGELLKKFTLDSYVEETGNFTAQLTERGALKSAPSSTVKVQGSIASKQLSKVEITDEIENVTSYELSETQFNQKLPASRFKYTPPKNAEVTEF